METVEDADEGLYGLMRQGSGRAKAGKRKAGQSSSLEFKQRVARALCSVLRGIGTSSLLNWGLGALPTSRRRARQS